MTETNFMHLSSEQELVHNRLRFQKCPPAARFVVEPLKNGSESGGADGTRTRDLRRDRPAF